jgi:hypothetical protein
VALRGADGGGHPSELERIKTERFRPTATTPVRAQLPQ